MSDSDEIMRAYYHDRAPVYDRVYGYPERQADLRELEAFLPAQFENRDVLEVAAGTGYWTAHLARCARSVTATDATPAALAQIAGRGVPDSVRTVVVDAYQLDKLSEQFSGAFAGLWFSHVPIERRAEFLRSLHDRLHEDAVIVLLDNSTAQCRRLPITDRDSIGNTYQDRRSDAGDVYRVLKNFPVEDELRSLVAGCAKEVQYRALEHFWLFQYRLAAADV